MVLFFHCSIFRPTYGLQIGYNSVYFSIQRLRALVVSILSCFGTRAQVC
jgi:hypothetical protein